MKTSPRIHIGPPGGGTSKAENPLRQSVSPFIVIYERGENNKKWNKTGPTSAAHSFLKDCPLVKNELHFKKHFQVSSLKHFSIRQAVVKQCFNE